MAFYRRRIIRIIPTFIVAVAQASIFLPLINGDGGWGYFWGNITLYNLAKCDITYWFIAHILLLYLIMPLLFKCSNHKFYIYIVAIFCVFIWITAYYTSLSEYSVLNVSFCRYPIFLMAVPLAVYIKKQVNIITYKGGGILAF